MYELMFFLHITGIAAWFGVAIMSALILLRLKPQLAQAGMMDTAQWTVRMFNRIAHPAATIVLLSGAIMVMEWDHKNLPFWMAFMERLGGLVILLYLIVISIMGRGMKKKLAGGDTAAASSAIGKYVSGVLIFSVLVLAVVLVASMKW